MTPESLTETLRLHAMWRRGETGGVRADLTGANLTGANLTGANLPPIPVVADLDVRVLAYAESGRLDMSQWHCGTTHCRAGAAIMEAGAEGAALEAVIGPCAAGALIYHASTGRVPDFFANNEDAIADIRRCAALRGGES